MKAIDLKLFYLLNNLAGASRAFDGIVIFFADYFQYVLVAAFLILLIASRYSYRQKLILFFVPFISAAIARLGATELIRLFYHRPRPFVVHSVHQLITDNEYSFPSGHATFFFALAMAVYFYNKKWGMGLFIAGALMTVSRVIAGVHYPSDIIGGLFIGIAIAYIVCRLSPSFNE